MGMLDFMNALLGLPPFVSILIISAVVSVVTTVVYKHTTNQKLMREIKEDVKRLQAEAKSAKDPSEAARLQKEMMKRSMQQLSSSTKSMLITLIPLFVVFGWMGTHLAYEPISPGEDFTTTAMFAAGVSGNATISATEGMDIVGSQSVEIAGGLASWRLEAQNEGRYQLGYSHGNEVYKLEVIVTKGFDYKSPVLDKRSGIKKDSPFERISVGLKPVHPFGSMSFLGWEPGWLGTYVILSIALSMLTRKFMKVY